MTINKKDGNSKKASLAEKENPSFPGSSKSQVHTG
jgi:hypothetical protein